MDEQKKQELMRLLKEYVESQSIAARVGLSITYQTCGCSVCEILRRLIEL